MVWDMNFYHKIARTKLRGERQFEGSQLLSRLDVFNRELLDLNVLTRTTLEIALEITRRCGDPVPLHEYEIR
jgi:hypothetical protein